MAEKEARKSATARESAVASAAVAVDIVRGRKEWMVGLGFVDRGLEGVGVWMGEERDGGYGGCIIDGIFG